jgi:NADP-dependent 3-hydroxy acid dehydrogenase YdfG
LRKFPLAPAGSSERRGQNLRSCARATSCAQTRHRGDRQKEKDYFDEFRLALDPADIARSIVFAQHQPPHGQIAEMMILRLKRYCPGADGNRRRLLTDPRES